MISTLFHPVGIFNSKYGWMAILVPQGIKEGRMSGRHLWEILKLHTSPTACFVFPSLVCLGYSHFGLFLGGSHSMLSECAEYDLPTLPSIPEVFLNCADIQIEGGEATQIPANINEGTEEGEDKDIAEDIAPIDAPTPIPSINDLITTSPPPTTTNNNNNNPSVTTTTTMTTTESSTDTPSHSISSKLSVMTMLLTLMLGMMIFVFTMAAARTFWNRRDHYVE